MQTSTRSGLDRATDLVQRHTQLTVCPMVKLAGLKSLRLEARGWCTVVAWRWEGLGRGAAMGSWAIGLVLGAGTDGEGRRVDGNALGLILRLVHSDQAVSQLEHVVAQRNDNELGVARALLDVVAHYAHVAEV